MMSVNSSNVGRGHGVVCRRTDDPRSNFFIWLRRYWKWFSLAATVVQRLSRPASWRKACDALLLSVLMFLACGTSARASEDVRPLTSSEFAWLDTFLRSNLRFTDTAISPYQVLLATNSSIAERGSFKKILFNKNRKYQEMTLRDKIESFEKSDEMRLLVNNDNDNDLRQRILMIMSEYIQLGMDYEEVIRVLDKNELNEESTYEYGNISGRTLKKYEKTIIVAINFYSVWGVLFGVYIQYRLIFHFSNNILEEMSAARWGVGP
jgi:hypothetical protein